MLGSLRPVAAPNLPALLYAAAGASVGLGGAKSASAGPAWGSPLPRFPAPDDAPGTSSAASPLAAPGKLGASGGSGGAAASSTGDADLARIRAEKKSLQLFLRDYERAFVAREGRPVQFLQDIQPVVAQYQRYKALKGLLRELGGPAAAPP